ncbi:MAG TPA: MarR family transcriptional regulator [Gammaproteobacteria bacterium]|nr:MarR family transcriptional regulator [Gammaproteobacteria bacterium]
MPRRRTSEELLHLFRENWPDGYSPAEEVMLRLYHAALRHTEELQRFLARFDLTTLEFVTLRVLRREPPPHVMTPSALHETLVLSAGGMTKIVKQLEAKGLVSRRPNEADKRSKLVALTPRGQAAIEAAQSAVRDFDFALLERTLTRGEQQRLAQLLRKLLVSLEPRRASAAVGFAAESLLRAEV